MVLTHGHPCHDEIAEEMPPLQQLSRERHDYKDGRYAHNISTLVMIKLLAIFIRNRITHDAEHFSHDISLLQFKTVKNNIIAVCSCHVEIVIIV